MSGYQLLTRPDSQPKAVKGQKKGYMTFVLHLAPSDLSGFNVCPNAGGCKVACLNKAGRGGFDPRVQVARIRKTRWYFADREAFMAALYKDIAKAIRYAEKKGFVAAFRLNGTSDIPWHRMGVMDAFPAVQFYDYTKVAKRLTRETLPVNYHLTFSLAEDNESAARTVLAAGGNVAAVFRDKATRSRYMQTGFLDAPVVDGDETDLRFLDPAGSVVGLFAKGPAKHDHSGFVRD
jgi:hypothetical protein